MIIKDIQTDQLRQVLRQNATISGIRETFVQRLWLVQNGEPYEAESPNSEDDIKILPTEPDGPTMWCPMREDWRDLPTVNG